MTRTALVVGAAVAIPVSLAGVLPVRWAVLLLMVLVWFAAPGMLLARRLYEPRGRWGAVLLAGPAWGYVLSSLTLLVFWIAGVRSFGWLILAPIPALVIAWWGSAAAGSLSLPAFSRRDVAPIAFVLLVVPLIVARPYSRVGVDLPEGRAYRAYFTADFIWEMAVVAEVSKGDVPPRNPYYLQDSLHYYWLMHLLPAAEHRTLGNRLPLEQLLLFNAFMSGLAFVGFLYFFVRHFVERPWIAGVACVGVIFCSSFEGIDQIWAMWRRGAAFDQIFQALRNVNIDAMTGWDPSIGGQRADGLHRLLLYQPQHQVGYLLGLSGLLILVESRDCSRPRLLFLVGCFLGASLLFSSVAAVMLGVMCAAYELWRLLEARQWKAVVPGALAAAVPVGAALALSAALQYVDTASGALPMVLFGVNRLSTRAVWTVLFLSFGPVLIVGSAGVVAAVRRGAVVRLLPIWIVLAVSLLFYFFVDIPEHQSVYVAWRSAHLIFIAAAPLCGYALEAAATDGAWPRRLVVSVATIAAIAAVPTVLMDLYNTQDIYNRAPGPGFRWTVVLSPDEVRALEWMKQWTARTARVQVEPNVRGRDTWAYVPAFGERRMSAGLPISMIPLAKYEQASNDIRRIYQSKSAEEAYDAALRHCIDFLVIGPPERGAYPQLQPMLDAHPHVLPVAFRNDAVTIYAVPQAAQSTACPR